MPAPPAPIVLPETNTYAIFKIIPAILHYYHGFGTPTVGGPGANQ